MKTIDFTGVVKNLKGEPIKQGDNELKISDIVGNALAISKPTNPTLTLKQYKLALRISDVKGEEAYEDIEITMIKDVIEKNELQYTTLIVGQILELISK
jgi:hypothetical protein